MKRTVSSELMVDIKPIIRIALCLALVSSLHATENEVALELTIPQQKTYVIGDRIQLNWNFTNQTTNSLAFIWEGCCRVNGRVEMKRLGTPPPPKSRVRPSHTGVGPGIYSGACLHCRLAKQRSELEVKTAPQGPATAHMFARAASLPGNGKQSFNSMLANWVLLEESGDYRLTGNYLGVHPKQRPQLLRRGRLWTGITKSPAIEISLLSVKDYLSERLPRTQVRGVELELKAPPKMIPFNSAKLEVEIINHTIETKSIAWPGDADIWIVNDQGVRLESSRYAVRDYGKKMELPSKTPQKLELAFDHELFEGQPFGKYQVFVELKETTNAIRVPSNAAIVDWNLDTQLVRDLLVTAADRPAVGSRNPQLKLMRVHLAELVAPLAAVSTEGMSDKAQALTQSLRLASQLKKIQPRPGKATLNLGVNANGVAAFQEPAIRQALGKLSDPFQQLSAIEAVRRHLGWTLAVNLRIDRQAQLSALAHVVASLAHQQIKPTTKVFNSNATAFSEVVLRPEAPYADDLTSIDDWASLPVHPTLTAPKDWTWQQLLKQAKPLIDQGRSFELVVR